MTSVNTKVEEIENPGHIQYSLNISDLDENSHNVDFVMENLSRIENMSI